MNTDIRANTTVNWGNINDLVAASTRTASPSDTSSSLANKEVFLQLLVTQLKNQDPLKPADGVEFVTQLAQFTQLEESMSLRQSVDEIKATIQKAVSDSATTQP